MNKAWALVLAAIAGLLLIAAPIVVSVQLARRQSLDAEGAQIASVATDIMRRSDETGAQLYRAMTMLQAKHGADPESPAAIAMMQQLDVSSSLIQFVGYIRNDRLICSSMGHHGNGIPLGPVTYRSANNFDFRVDAELPFAPGSKFLVVSSPQGFAGFIHPSLVVDAPASRPNLIVGLYAYSNGLLMLQRGTFNPYWRTSLGKGYSADFFDGRYLVSLRRSQGNDFVAFAAAPASKIDVDVRRFATVLVPLGVVLGLILAGALMHLTRQQLSLPAVIRGALRRREFYVLYQPLVDLQTGKWSGAEALLRWKRKGGEEISPDLFIPAAESSGLSQKLTSFVLETSFRECSPLLKGQPGFHVGINASASDLESKDFVAGLRELITDSDVAPQSIMVEATEQGFLNTEKARSTVAALRELGIRVAIDDFGTGYSSLSYLTSLKVDYLKIDKTFVETIGAEAATSEVIFHIISMAKSLNLTMIAEGVETEDQARFLREHGVQLAQGWLFARAMSAEELIAGAATPGASAREG